MRAKDIIPASKPRNFVAKNQKTAGAGAHKDKKKAEKQGDVKHKGKEFAEEVAEARKANSASARAEFGKRPRKDTLSDKEKDQKKADSDADWERLMAYANEKKKQEVGEAGMYRRPGSPTAYDRDYASSVSGMGHKDSLAYRMDGGANDEGEDDAPYQHKDDKPVLKGYYFYDVPAGKEDEAAIYGVKKTKNGKWAKALYSTSGRSFSFQKQGADKAFGPGKFWSPNK